MNQLHPSCYAELLEYSYKKSGSNITLGIDPQWNKLPKAFRKLVHTSSGSAPDCNAILDFLFASLQQLQRAGFCPAAFKPNLGYFQVLDRPQLLEEDIAFAGSRLLAQLLRYLRAEFAGIPIILDFKKADIARSSANYAEEGFLNWGCDALTVSPYMGSDSLFAFGSEAVEAVEVAKHRDFETTHGGLAYGKGGVYSLLRTSNLGSKDLQDLLLEGQTGLREPLYLHLGRLLLQWRKQIPGLGAVVGATSLEELGTLAELFAGEKFPLLIPGVGKQGGSLEQVLQVLRSKGYPLEFARINLSSGLLQNWQGEAPLDWQAEIVRHFEVLHSLF